MYTRKVFPIKAMAYWTKYETALFTAIILAFIGVYELLDLHWLRIPWTPIALVGTAVAFVIGFQNNSAYGRIWEARKIWGGIVNTSRTFGMFAQDMITNDGVEDKVSQAEVDAAIKTVTYRHIAWMTALRHSMRQKKSWETLTQEKTNRTWQEYVHPPEFDTQLQDDLAPYLSKEDMDYVMSKNNKQTAILYLQSHHLRELKEKGMIWQFSFLELENTVEELFTLQGKSERIKNFPYPRHFASLNHYFMWLFVFILPLAIVPQFAEIGRELALDYPVIGKYFVWFTTPFYVIVAWIFHTMERIGRTGENPFEGSANDVPISTISRGIEIDLRQNLGETADEIPAQFPEKYDTQM
jgi:putative membrane protein